mgnify:CR=1 FL=1
MHFSLKSSVGDGHDNDPDDIADLEDSLVTIGAFTPRRGRPGPLPVITPELDMAVSRYQADRGLKVDGVLHPGGPTERAIQNDLAGKPRGAGLAPPPGQRGAAGKRQPAGRFRLRLQDGIGEGEVNVPTDVKRTKQALGAIGLMPEDPFDNPMPYLDGTTNQALFRFQSDQALKTDAIARPGGPTEAALEAAVNDQLSRSGPEIAAYLRRVGGGAARPGADDDVTRGGVQLAGHMPKGSVPATDGKPSETLGDRIEPAQSTSRSRVPVPVPGWKPYVPSKEDMERIGRDLRWLGSKLKYRGHSFPHTNTKGPDPDKERSKKPLFPKGPDIDKERNRKAVPEGFSTEIPKLQPPQSPAPPENKTITWIDIGDMGIQGPLILENSLGNEKTQKDVNDVGNSLEKYFVKHLGRENVEISHGGVNENGERRKEEYIPNKKAKEMNQDARIGSRRADFTIRREREAAQGILENSDPNQHLFQHPKLGPDEKFNEQVLEAIVKWFVRRIRYGKKGPLNFRLRGK